MKKIKSFEEFINESTINEGEYFDVWPSIPGSTWEYEYEISKNDQEDLYATLQDELGTKNPKIKEDEIDNTKSPFYKEIQSLGEYNSIWSWTSDSESTSAGAWKLKNGDIFVSVYQAYSFSDPKEHVSWIVGK
jgi:hypothetical protein